MMILKTFFCKSIAVLAGLWLCWCGVAKGQTYDSLDYLIKGALVFDGTENAATQMDIGIEGNKIAYIGNSAEDKVRSKETISAKGLYLCPGFIDSHTHYTSWLGSGKPTKRANIPCLSQGVTTVFLGSDGGGTYHVKAKLAAYEKNGIGTNVALWVGFGSVRRAVLGNDDLQPDEQQLEKEKELVAQGMKEGALGLSTGLFYTPQVYAKTEEVIALAAVAKKYGGTYDTHMRSESSGLIPAVQETIDIGKTTGIPVHISHIKCLGPAAWGTSEDVIKQVEHARKVEKVNVTACQYPYLASHTSFSAMVIPPWAKSGGTKAMLKRFDNPDTLRSILEGLSIKLALRGGDGRITLSSTDSLFNGKTLHQVAASWGVSPEKAAIRILRKQPGIGANSFSMIEEDLEHYMVQPWVMTCSDGGSTSHPRTYSSFIRKIKKYVLAENLIAMSDAIYKATGQTATFFGLKNRGFIRKGYYADIVLFDPQRISDNATYMNPDELATGINYVFVNGRVAMKGGVSTDVLSGMSLRHQQ